MQELGQTTVQSLQVTPGYPGQLSLYCNTYFHIVNFDIRFLDSRTAPVLILHRAPGCSVGQ